MPARSTRVTRSVAFAWMAVTLSFLLTAAASADQTESGPDWALLCELQDFRFELRFHSPSGDALSDDMRVSLGLVQGQPIALDLDPAWFKPARLRHRLRSVCEGSDGFELSPGRILVLFSADRRPGLDAVFAVLVDAAHGRIIGPPLLVGEMTEDARVRRRRNGVEIEVVQTYLGSAELEETPELGWRRIRAMAAGLQVD